MIHHHPMIHSYNITHRHPFFKIKISVINKTKKRNKKLTSDCRHHYCRLTRQTTRGLADVLVVLVLMVVFVAVVGVVKIVVIVAKTKNKHY